MRTDTSTINIERGLLFPYNSSVAVYHCPADKSTVVDANGVPLAQTRTRSYNMSSSVHCYSAPSYTNYLDILEPEPSGLFVFIDVHEDDIIDSTFGIGSASAGFADFWIDLPADRHNRGANVSFADGHVEHWRWMSPKHFEHWIQSPADPGDWLDLRRLQQCAHP